MNHTHHHFLITLAVAVTIFVASLYFYMSYSLGNMTQMVVDTRSKVTSLQARKEVNDKLKKLGTDSAMDWDKLSRMFVSTDDAVPFIESLESLGKDVGSEVSVTSIDSVAGEKGSLATNGYVNAKVSARGSWSEVLKTLMLAENMPYKTTVSNVRMSLYNDGSDVSVAGWGVNFDVSSIKSI